MREFIVRAFLWRRLTTLLASVSFGGTALAGRTQESAEDGTWQRFRLFADVTSELGDDLQEIAGSIGFGIRW